MFKALVLERTEDGTVTSAVRELDDADLPQDGDVTVRISHSTLNYKDGLCLTGRGGLVRKYPHVPGVDFAGEVEASSDPRYAPGDSVILTGWRVGENWWGGYAEKARVKADWLVPMPAALDSRLSMGLGTAGFTAMLAIIALEEHGLRPGEGPMLVTGAGGGVGSVATALLSDLGYEVAAVTGRPALEPYLRNLGASEIIPRDTLNEPASRPLESETWAGCVDAVGGVMLARVLAQLKHGASAAAVGLAGGASMKGTIIPFLLRECKPHRHRLGNAALRPARAGVGAPRGRDVPRPPRIHDRDCRTARIAVAGPENSQGSGAWTSGRQRWCLSGSVRVVGGEFRDAGSTDHRRAPRSTCGRRATEFGKHCSIPLVTAVTQIRRLRRECGCWISLQAPARWESRRFRAAPTGAPS